MPRLRFALIFLCSILTNAAGAETPTFDPDRYVAFDGRGFSLPAAANIPPEAMTEMQEAYAVCTGRSFYDRLHDCGCAAMTFLEARIAAPDTAVFTLRRDAQEACVDPDLIEAVEAQKCLNSPRLQGTQEEKVAQCTCVASSVKAAYIASDDDVTNRAFQALRRDARRACITP